jgi:hypothetical protein
MTWLGVLSRDALQRHIRADATRVQRGPIRVLDDIQRDRPTIPQIRNLVNRNLFAAKVWLPIRERGALPLACEGSASATKNPENNPMQSGTGLRA